VKVLKSCVASLGTDSVAAADFAFQLGCLYADHLNDLDGAGRLLSQSFSAYNTALGPGHFQTVKARARFLATQELPHS
jgi:hypothetical protein